MKANRWLVLILAAACLIGCQPAAKPPADLKLGAAYFNTVGYKYTFTSPNSCTYVAEGYTLTMPYTTQGHYITVDWSSCVTGKTCPPDSNSDPEILAVMEGELLLSNTGVFYATQNSPGAARIKASYEKDFNDRKAQCEKDKKVWTDDGQCLAPDAPAAK